MILECGVYDSNKYINKYLNFVKKFIKTDSKIIFRISKRKLEKK